LHDSNRRAKTLSFAIDTTDDETAMPYFPLKQRLKIALGGFVSFVGFILLIFAFLTTTKAANLESVIQNELIAVAMVVGILDILCGFLLFRKRRK
jgi:hypothetical protein